MTGCAYFECALNGEKANSGNRVGFALHREEFGACLCIYASGSLESCISAFGEIGN